MIIKNGKTISSVIKGSRVIDKIIKGTLVVYEAFKNLIVSGIPPLTLTKCKGVDLIDYKLYGNSLQNGTPTPDTPIEVESVGEKTKNLYNPAWDSRFKLQEDGSYLSNIVINAYTNILGSEKLPIGIYTISVKVKSPVGTNYRIRVVYSDGTFTDNYKDSTGEYIDINLTTIGKEIKEIIWYYSATSAEVQFKEFQIEEGYITTDYEPYGYKIPVKVSNETEEITTNIYLNEPLRKIGDYADYIDFENKKVVRNIAVKEFNGTEAIDIPGNTMEGFTPFRYLAFMHTGKYPYLCNYLEYSSEYYSLNEKECLGIYNGNINGQMFFIISNERIPLGDITSFKNWLAELYSAGTPLIVYYGLETPTEETIELPNTPTIKGTTILEVDTTIQPSNMEVVYKGKK